YSLTRDYKGDENPRKVGEELKVLGVIMGRVTARGGSAYNIHVELVDVATGSQVFGKSYDLELPSQTFTQVSQQIAEDIAGKLHISVVAEGLRPVAGRPASVLSTAVIYGSVYDTEQRPIPGAEVELVNASKSFARSTATDREGSFVFDK